MTWIICLVGFAGMVGRKIFSTVIAPALGGLLNIGMLVGVIYYAITAGGASQLNTIIAIAFSVGWLLVGFGYLYMRKLTKGIPILHAEDHKEKLQEIPLGAAELVGD